LHLTTWGDDTITRSGRIEPHDAPENRAAHPTEINPGRPGPPHRGSSALRGRGEEDHVRQSDGGEEQTQQHHPATTGEPEWRLGVSRTTDRHL
jgi:hypothetical protein